jgi:hypothetical protein
MDTSLSGSSTGESTRSHNPPTEESIPLVEHVEDTSMDAVDDGAKKLAIVSPATQESVPEQSESYIGAVEDRNDISAFSFIRSRLEQPLSLPIRIGCILFVLWAVNLAWGATSFT